MKLLFSSCVLIFSICVLPASTFLNPLKLLNVFKPRIWDIIDSSINQTACGRDLKLFITDLFREQLWALSMFDASSKLQNGLLSGNTHSFGNYDQCLSIKKELQDNVVLGQYCTMTLILKGKTRNLLLNILQSGLNNKHKAVIPLSVSTHYGLCIPKSCSVPNVTALFNHVQKRFFLPFQIKFREEACYYKDKEVPGSSIDKYVLLFFFLILALELASTCYDLHLRKNNEEPNIFVSFSWYTNIKRLFSTEVKNDTLTCLYGIRALSIIWVVLGHTALLKSFVSSNQFYIISEWPRNLPNTFFSAAPYAVDTFFAMSGLLVVYVYFKVHEMFKIKNELFWFYVFRLGRLVPTMVATMLFNITMTKYFVNGPLTSNAFDLLKTNCENNWWTTLFFVNNFVNSTKQCIMSAWYLAVETQLHLLAPFLLYGFRQNPQKSFLAILSLCVFSFAYNWIAIIENNSGFLAGWEVSIETLHEIYFSTFNRMPAWLVGTCCGYCLYNNKIKISKTTNLILWTLSLGTMLSFVLYHVVFFQEEFNVYRSAFFNVFSRPLWAAAVCYIIFSCCTGSGGYVNAFLSHPVFIVLGRLTYNIYLNHSTVLYLLINSVQQTTHFSSFSVFFDFCGSFPLILLLSFVMYVVFEIPFVSFMHRKLKKLLI